jgi:hypothetical protein
VKNPKTGKIAPPRFLGEPGTTLSVAQTDEPANDAKNRSGTVTRRADAAVAPGGSDELQLLANWLTSAENPFFARAQVNRVWYHLMGRGIVDPIDDFRATNPASHPELLEALVRDFLEHKFDLRHLIRRIMNSRAYQLSSEPNETNPDDDVNFSRALVRRLSAEQLLDCQHEAMGVPAAFSGYPRGWRAAQLPGLNFEKRRREKTTKNEQFLKLFGKPPRLLTCECERSTETTMGQAFHMISGPSMNDLLTHQDNRLAKLLSTGITSEKVIDELYWSTLTRSPSPAELHRSVKHLDSSADRRAALEDLTWSLLNAKEFLLRR